MAWVAVAVTGFNALNQIQQGRYANAQAQLQAGQMDYRAKVEEENALKTAQIIRNAGRKQVGQANAAYAAAGVKVGEGSALEIERQIDTNVEHDAFQAILDGQRKAIGLRTDADLTRISGKQQESAGYVNAVGTVLQGASSYMRATGGWKTGSLSGWDAGGFNGTNDRGRISVGSNTDWFMRNGKGGD